MKHLIVFFLTVLPAMAFIQNDTTIRHRDIITIYFDKARVDKYGLNFKKLCKKMQAACKPQFIRMDSNSIKCECILILKPSFEAAKKVENYKVNEIKGTPVFIKDIATIAYQNGKEE